MQSLKPERLETSPSYKIRNKMTLAMSPSVRGLCFLLSRRWTGCDSKGHTVGSDSLSHEFEDAPYERKSGP